MSLISAKAVYWIKTLSKFVSVQVGVQLLGAITGILLIRLLDQKQYAYYTIAISMQATISLLSSMGIVVGLSAIGGKVWQDKYRFGQLINTALKLRYYLAGIWVIALAPILVWLLVKNGTSITYAVLIAIGVLLGLNFDLTNGVYNVVIRLHSQIGRIQALDLVLAISKLVLLGVAYLTVLNAAVATAATSVAFGIQRFILGRWVTDSIDKKALVSEEYRTELIKIMRQSAPNVIYYSVQGQITVGLISLFGNVQSVAEVAALGRLGIIFSILGSVMNSIVTPRFARCQSPKLLYRRYWQIIGTVGLAELILVGIAALFPKQLLWLLGNQYSHLESEVILIVAGAASFSFVNNMWSLNASKAWIGHVWLQVPGTILSQILSILVVDFTTVRGAIIFGMSPIIPAFCLNAYMTYQGLKQTKQAL